MKNLHLMPMGSLFDVDLVRELNSHFSLQLNSFFLAKEMPELSSFSNCHVIPDAFSVDFINNHTDDYDQIFIHSLFLSDADVLRLTTEAKKKMIWCVWGHDLYNKRIDSKLSFRETINELIHLVKKILRGTLYREAKKKKLIKQSVGQFKAICIGYPYDEVMIRKRYGTKVPVLFAPYFTNFSKSDLFTLKEYRSGLENRSTRNIIIGHSGYEFIQHEKYLDALSVYKDENICVNMVLCYGASPERVSYLTKKATDIFGENKVRVLTKMMPREEYFRFLCSMDVAIFPYLHQSALHNTEVMAFVGVKMYFHPKGVLYKGFDQAGIPVFDCRTIGKISFFELCQYNSTDTSDSPIYGLFDYDSIIEAWKRILEVKDWSM